MKWEYAIFVIDTRTEDAVAKLNSYGAQGWEIIDADPAKTIWLYHAKRPVDAAAANLRIDLGQPADKPKE